MSQNKLAKLRNTDVFKACMRVLEEYRIPNEDFDVLDKRPHPMLTVRYCSVVREMSLPSTPKTRGKAPMAYAAQLRRLLKEMQMSALSAEKANVAAPREASQVQQEIKSVVVAGSVVRRIEFRGQQVVTFAMIDEVHGRPDGTAGRTFRENRDRFTEGQDFVLLPVSQSDEIRRYGVHVPNRGLTLITRRGYLKITKSLNDDKAWDVFDEMVERYFAVGVPAVEATIAQLPNDVRTVLGGIIKSVVHREMEIILHETRELRSQVSGLLVGSDPRVAVLEFVSVAQLLEEGKAIQKGRRALNQKIGHALQSSVSDSGVPSNRRRCPHSGKWLFQRDFADAYMRREGRRLIREHNDNQRGQTFIQFDDGKVPA